MCGNNFVKNQFFWILAYEKMMEPQFSLQENLFWKVPDLLSLVKSREFYTFFIFYILESSLVNDPCCRDTIISNKYVSFQSKSPTYHFYDRLRTVLCSIIFGLDELESVSNLPLYIDLPQYRPIYHLFSPLEYHFQVPRIRNRNACHVLIYEQNPRSILSRKCFLVRLFLYKTMVMPKNNIQCHYCTNLGQTQFNPQPSWARLIYGNKSG